MMKNEPTRRNFLGRSLGAAIALLAAKGFHVTEVKAQEGALITIAGLTSCGGARPHVHGFEARLNLETGEFSGTTNSTISTGQEKSAPHTHAIADTVDPFDFDAVVATSTSGGHIHQVRPN